LTRLPEEVCSLDSLTALDLTHNQLAALPPDLPRLHLMGSLALTHNQLAALPPLPSGLVALQAAHNKVGSQAGDYAGCSALTKVDLSHNPPLADIPGQTSPHL
ncbi:uncharacterized protein HaLaN_26822, partial [Haematococcus lacustris]